MNFLLLILKGFIIGIANIIPGVSGGTLALILGVYERLISILGSFWKNFKENLKFLFPIFLGAIIAILACSKIIEYSLDKFPIPTIMLFIGLIIGGIPLLYKNISHKYSVKNIGIFLIVASLVVLFTIFSGNNEVDLDHISFGDNFILIGVGGIAAATMIIPGISGSMVLMSIGYYKGIIGAVSGLTNLDTFAHSLRILLPFGIGVIIGMVLIARLISFLLKRFPTETYFGIFAFILTSIYGILYKMNATFDIWHFICGIILLIGGFLISFFVARIEPSEDSTSINKP